MVVSADPDPKFCCRVQQKERGKSRGTPCQHTRLLPPQTVRTGLCRSPRSGRGNRHFVYLGTYNTEESRAEYRRVLVEWEASGRRLPMTIKAAQDITVNELALAYLNHAEGYYTKDGEHTKQLDRIRSAIRVLRSTHGHTFARDFGPKSLKAVRENMLSVPVR